MKKSQLTYTKQLIVCMTMFIFMFSCNSDERDWEEATQTGTVEAYKVYLKLNKDGKYLLEAQKKIVDLNWKSAVATNSTDAIKKFLEAYPESIYEEVAITKLRSFIDPRKLQIKQTAKLSEAPVPRNLEVIVTRKKQEFQGELTVNSNNLTQMQLGDNIQTPHKDYVFLIAKWEMTSTKKEDFSCNGILEDRSGKKETAYAPFLFGQWTKGTSTNFDKNQSREMQWLFIAREDQLDGALLSILGWEYKLSDNFDPRTTKEFAADQYSDPNGFFKIMPPDAWQIQQYQDDPRGKVAFHDPNGSELRILAKGLDYNSFEEMLKEIKGIEKKISVNTNIEKITFSGMPALKRKFTYNGLETLFIDFMIGNTSHNIMYSAEPSIFEKYLSIAQESIDTYEPTLKGVSVEDVKKHSIARSLRLSKIFYGNMNYKLALEYVNEGLEVDPNNTELLKLKEKIEKIN